MDSYILQLVHRPTLYDRCADRWIGKVGVLPLCSRSGCSELPARREVVRSSPIPDPRGHAHMEPHLYPADWSQASNSDAGYEFERNAALVSGLVIIVATALLTVAALLPALLSH